MPWKGRSEALAPFKADVSPMNTRMKKRAVLVAAVAIGAWLLIDMVRDFFANDTLGYYTAEPARLLHVAVIAMVGGLAAWAVDRAPPRSKRLMKIVALGIAGSALTVVAVGMVVGLAALTSFPESGCRASVLLSTVLSAVVAAYLWFEFYRAVKSGVSL